ncbi:hypothetical protein SAMN05216202_2604 [Pseudomonas mucidolens]|uniref:Uncharacterized protein n=1 Tax=Pseudomonas mucidolens TaxID=46679 RepID=A0A1H2MXR6_9PSED|nr:hypothetical protein SAMN05216202_2604 [Pseudomonas mucidolens]SQH33006.1 Uncharacterised protein [Pseudomonas mucidolens]
MLAKIVNDDAGNLTPRGDLRFFASKLAPTEGGSAFDRDLKFKTVFTGGGLIFCERASFL